MKKQIIVTICREYGSAGHFIAKHLAAEMEIPIYNKDYLLDMCSKFGYTREVMEKYDERPVRIFMSKRRGHYTNSVEQIIYDKIASFIRERAESGESFVVVGRCSDHILRNNPNAVHIFVTGNMKEKIKRISELYNLSREDAIDIIKKKDRKRRNFHNRHSDRKWGDSRAYHMCINAASIGIENAVGIIRSYVEAFKNE
ncbi:MAG: cytidylate kinase-like family protein [Clostridia bacterium]|nr:cytidylate kinase-like family protein [Clostridia bacterium]